MNASIDAAQIERFIIRESRLLDDERWQDWSALFTPDGLYWMPAAPGQADHKQHVSLICDDALLRDVRIKRFGDAGALSLQPAPRTLRQLGGIVIQSDREASGDWQASARLVAVQQARGSTRWFMARCDYRIAASAEGLRLRLKRVELVDCDAPLGDIHHYL